MDIFLKQDVNKLLCNKFIVFMGDSNIRALYKDLLCLKRKTLYIKENQLRKKLEPSAFGDQLLTEFPRINSRKFIEEREAKIDGTKMAFYFITRVYDFYVERILKRISLNKRLPDVFVVNSCLWDITRWGPRGVESFKLNLIELMKDLKKRFPDCLVIWITTPPVAQEMKGGFLVKELEFMKYSLRFHVVEANHFAWKTVRHYGFDVLDSHYHLKMQIKRRAKDGIHWMPDAVRYVSNLLLTHISLAWGVPLPHRYTPMTEQNLIPDCINEYNAKEHGPKDLNKIQSIVFTTTASNSSNVKGCEKSSEEPHHSEHESKDHKRRKHTKHESRKNSKTKKIKQNELSKHEKEDIQPRITLETVSKHKSFKNNEEDERRNYELDIQRTIIQSIVIVPQNSTKNRKLKAKNSIIRRRKN